MSYRGRTLVSNNLVSSFLWHRLAGPLRIFSLRTFVFGFKYRKMHTDKCQLLNFVPVQSKMSICVSRKRG